MHAELHLLAQSPVHAPASARDGTSQSPVQMRTVAPLGSLRFRAAPRKLPQIRSITLSKSAEHAGSLQPFANAALQNSQQGSSALQVLLELHDQLQSNVTSQRNGQIRVCYSGVDKGDITVSTEAMELPAEGSTTGLEGTAESGKGWGISAFQPCSPHVPSLYTEDTSPSSSSSSKSSHLHAVWAAEHAAVLPWKLMLLQMHAANLHEQCLACILDCKTGFKHDFAPKQCADGASHKATSSQAAHWRPWSQAEIDAAQTSTSGSSSEPPSGFSNTFTNFVTQTYARYAMDMPSEPWQPLVVCIALLVLTLYSLLCAPSVILHCNCSLHCEQNQCSCQCCAQ